MRVLNKDYLLDCVEIKNAILGVNRYDSNVTLANQKVTARKPHKLCSLCLQNCSYKNMQSLGWGINGGKMQDLRV